MDHHFNEFEYRPEDGDVSTTTTTDSIQDKIPEILKAFETNRVLVLTGDTGCGKTTQIPKLLMDRFKNIICTQPRRLATINTAKHIARNLNCALGSIVGYTIRYNNVTSKDTVLRIVTDGILLNEITHSNKKKYNKSFSTRYDLIIIDEAHERSLNIEFLLGYFKNVMLKDLKHIETRILIMSATLHTEKFIRYFDNCPLVEIKCRRYKIDHYYLKEEYYNPYNLIENCVKTVMNILSKQDDEGDILIFLSGQSQIEAVESLLSEHCKSSSSHHNVSILKLYSLLPQNEQNLIFASAARDRRKIILSTNIAETSITIKNIKYVIDSGKVKIMQNSLNAQSLVEKNISKSQAKQRAGRAGRTQPGIVYRLYSQHFYDNEMDQDPEPEILRSNLNSIILSLKKIGIEDVYNFKFIDEIPPSLICSSVNYLKAIECLQVDYDYYYRKEEKTPLCLTRIGKEISDLPLDPEMAKCLHVANRLGCVKSVSTIIAFLNHSPNFFINMRKNHPNYKEYLSTKSKFNHYHGCDFFTFLNIYHECEMYSFSSKFLERNYLNPKTMREIRCEQNKLFNYFKSYDDDDDRNANTIKNDENNFFNIQKAFYSGFFKNVAKSSSSDGGKNNYKLLLWKDDDYCKIDKRDGMFESENPLPEYILFIQLNVINGGQKFMRHCLKIDQDLYNWAEKKCIKYNLL